MKGESKSWKRYSSCVTLNHCLLTFLIVISSVNYSHGFWDWVPGWTAYHKWILSILPCVSSEFECHSKSLCIDETLVCDGINDCDDGSDELNICEGRPQILKADFICGNNECPGLSNSDPSLPLCTQEDFSNIHLLCNYQQGRVPLVIFSTLNALYETSLPEDDAKIHVNKTLQFYLSGISAFHYDIYNDLFIWLDKSKNKIYWTLFWPSERKKNELEIIKHQVFTYGTHKIHGFVYDWMKNVLIWVDDYGIRSRKIPETSLMNTEQQPKLYRTLNPSYHRLGSITIDVKKHYVFWANIGTMSGYSGNNFIERIDINGEPRTEKIVKRLIAWPLGLAIDTKNTKVYWIDGLFGTLESVGYDGTNRIILYDSLPLMHDVISMDIFANYLYFTNKTNNTIQRININNAVKKVDTLISVPNGSPTWVKISI